MSFYSLRDLLKRQPAPGSSGALAPRVCIILSVIVLVLAAGCSSGPSPAEEKGYTIGGLKPFMPLEAVTKLYGKPASIEYRGTNNQQLPVYYYKNGLKISFAKASEYPQKNAAAKSPDSLIIEEVSLSSTNAQKAGGTKADAGLRVTGEARLGSTSSEVLAAFGPSYINRHAPRPNHKILSYLDLDSQSYVLQFFLDADKKVNRIRVTPGKESASSAWYLPR